MVSLHDVVTSVRQGTGPVAAPWQAEISIMGGCNLSCVQCHQHHHIVEERQAGFGGARRLPLAMVLDTLRQLHRLGTERIIFCGRGEPTLHPGLPEMIAEARRLNFHVSLVTNGSSVGDELLDALQSGLLQAITVSLYAGDEASFAEISAPKDKTMLATIVGNLHRLAKAGEGASVEALVIVQPPMVESLPALWAIERELSGVRWTYLAARPYANGRQIGGGESSDVAGKLAERLASLPMAGATDSFRSFLAEFIADPQLDAIRSVYSTVPCRAGHWAIYICDDGTVRACSNSSKPLGRIDTHDLADIWSGEAYCGFRSSAASEIIATGRPLPGYWCSHCGWARFHAQLDAAARGKPSDELSFLTDYS
jgi:MoaA/NifB/PqqE/SkfB family radical SAM enzyme